MSVIYCEDCRRSTAGFCANHFRRSYPAPTLPAPAQMTGPHKCPDCSVWWVGFEHRCRPLKTTIGTNAGVNA